MKYILQLSLLLLILGCNSDKKETIPKKEYKRWVGDIGYDESKDSKLFNLCNDESNAYQYFNDSNGLQYEGERKSIYNVFKSKYSIQKEGQTGLVRIRFMVNCEGKAGRFRVLGMDNNYKAKEYDSSITTELLRITKTLDKWKPKVIDGARIDYYQYLIFKLEDGKIIEILP